MAKQSLNLEMGLATVCELAIPVQETPIHGSMIHETDSKIKKDKLLIHYILK